MYPKDLFPSQLLFHIKPYYISIFTYRKQPVFQDKYACELLLNVLTYNKYALDYLVYAFVIMPDHLHIVFHPCKVPISQVVRKNMGNFTRYYQKYTGRNQPVWEQDYYELQVKDYPGLQKIREHIHTNPLRNGLENEIGTYYYSSYRFYEKNSEDFFLLLNRLQL